jgi:DNA-binding Lrp family transcriptional regulator
MAENHFAVSQEIKVSTPTVKARYDRLVNMGLVKSVKPKIDLSKIDIHKQKYFFSKEKIKQLREQKKLLRIKNG